MIREIEKKAWHGLAVLPVLLAAIGYSVYRLVQLSEPPPLAGILGWLAVIVVAGVCLRGFFLVEPNQGKVLTFFGSYAGTAKNAGLRWANPFYAKRGISLRVRNFETDHLKVNDHSGNPIEIAAVVVWRVVDTAEAVFEVDDYENFVRVQSESALRNLATRYPYDSQEPD